MRAANKIIATITAAALLSLLGPVVAQEPQKPDSGTAPIRVSTELVLVNVVARDKKGNPVRDMKQADFTLYEDGKKTADLHL